MSKNLIKGFWEFTKDRRQIEICIFENLPKVKVKATGVCCIFAWHYNSHTHSHKLDTVLPEWYMVKTSSFALRGDRLNSTNGKSPELFKPEMANMVETNTEKPTTVIFRGCSPRWEEQLTDQKSN